MGAFFALRNALFAFFTAFPAAASFISFEPSFVSPVPVAESAPVAAPAQRVIIQNGQRFDKDTGEHLGPV